MLNLKKAIFAKLSGSTLASYIGGRLFDTQAQDGSEYPHVVYLVVTDVPEKTFTEDYENVLIQFSLFSTTQDDSTEIETMFGYLKTLYDECAMTITGSTLVWMKRVTSSGPFIEEHTTPAGTIQVWHRPVEYEIKTSLT